MSAIKFRVAICLLPLTLLSGGRAAQADILDWLRCHTPDVCAWRCQRPAYESKEIADLVREAEGGGPQPRPPALEQAGYVSSPAPGIAPQPAPVCNSAVAAPCESPLSWHERFARYRERKACAWRTRKGESYYCPCPPYYVQNFGYFPTCWRALNDDCLTCPPPFQEPIAAPLPPSMAPPQVPPFQQLLQLREPIAEPDENPTAGA
jgi:hypothetical protein